MKKVNKITINIMYSEGYSLILIYLLKFFLIKIQKLFILALHVRSISFDKKDAEIDTPIIR